MIKKSEYTVSIFLLIIGLLFSSSFIISYFYILTSKDWLELNAFVVKSELLEKGFFSPKSGYKTSDKYELEIKYFINGKEFKNQVITTEKNSEYLLIKYNPKNADEIQIITNTKKGMPWIMTFFGVIMCVAGLFLFIQSIIISIITIRNTNNEKTNT